MSTFVCTDLGQRLQLLNSCLVECSRVALEVTEGKLALDTSLFLNSSNVAFGEVARVDLADHIVVSSDRGNIGIRLELDDVFAGNDCISLLACDDWSSAGEEGRGSCRQSDCASEELHD